MSQFDQKKIFEALKYLRNNNPLYSDIEIDKNSLLRLLSTDFTDDIPITLEERTRHENHNSRNENILEDKEEIENTLQKYQHLASESLVVNNDIYEIAPGEGFSTKRILYDENYEQLAFPQCFRKGRFGYSVCHYMEIMTFLLCSIRFTGKDFQGSNINSYKEKDSKFYRRHV